MRDMVLLSFVVICLIITLRYPFVGILTWAWFTLMTPHQAAFGLTGIPVNAIIAGVTLIAVFASKELWRFRLDSISGLILALAGWLTISQTFSLDAEYSAPYYDRFMKALVFIFMVSQMASDKLRFHALIWVLVIAIGFFAAKGAVFTVATLGQHHVMGMPHTVLEDNNHFGIATATILPMILYLHSQAARPWVRRGLLVLFGMSIVAIIGTQSRGAFIALVVFAGFFWLRSQRKMTILAGLFLIMAPTIAFMPAKWTDRMSTISEASKDSSFMGRVDAWIINAKLAAENPVTGVGLRNSYQKKIAMTVDLTRAERARAAHSIYFEVLGGAGYIGLGIYLMLFANAFFSARTIYQRRSDPAVAPWQSGFAYHAQISLIVFAVGGASISIEMWEGYLVVIALIAALTRQMPKNERTPDHAFRDMRTASLRRKRAAS